MRYYSLISKINGVEGFILAESLGRALYALGINDSWNWSLSITWRDPRITSLEGNRVVALTKQEAA